MEARNAIDTVPRRAAISRKRLIALVAIGLAALFLAFLRFMPAASVAVPDGARAGDLFLEPGSFTSGGIAYPADVGTLVVPENREAAGSRLIALPVVRIRARAGASAEPVFILNGGPGKSNMTFDHTARIAGSRDVVLVGYRGVDGSSRLDAPEVISALKHSRDLLDDDSLRRYSEAFASYAERLQKEGVDVRGYTLPEQADDIESARIALGYGPIDLLSESAGTRLAMVYSWRYPESLLRSVMIGVNPPGHFLYDAAAIDDLLYHYSDLLSRDEKYGGRTDDLASLIRNTAADMPDRWLFLPIKPGNVKVASVFGLAETTEKLSPMYAPVVLQSWLSAAEGDPSGFWFLSFLSDLAFPEAFVWGEFAGVGSMDNSYVDAYYSAAGDSASVLGNPGTDFLWGGGGLAGAWPVSPSVEAYSQARTSDIETLLVGGNLDILTPPVFAADELLPFLTRGHQVVLSEFGHTEDFWDYQPEAGTRLINAFLDSGEVDDSLYTYRRMDFTPKVTAGALAKGFLGTMVGLALVTVFSLLWMRRRVNRRGAFGPKAAVWNRSVLPVFIGLGGWFLAVLVVMSVWPAVPLDNMLIAVLSIGIPIGLGIYWSWVHRDWLTKIKSQGFWIAMGGALLGAWMGFNATSGLMALITTIVGAAVVSNLAIIILDISQDLSTRHK